MYLFQPLEIQHRAQYQSNLHSTMYLFQPIVDSTARVSVWDLHSTMYLFQQGQTYTEVWASAYLHSTMYLFQPTAKKIIKDYYLFTFHYVSISTFTAHFISDIVTCIYIPLCTYFNRRNCCINSASSRIYIPLRIYFNLIVCDFLHLDFLFTFHYVSISTITPMVALVRPLHLHSTMYLFQLHSRSFILISFIIYIPLCIYFNPIRKAAAKKPSKFTFHYVSISTILTKYAIQYIKQFTFHYVSISTLSAVVRPILMILIYIPLCIYFNLLEGFALGLVLVFTFHYVSISTSGKTLSAVKRLVFTFHYVSISTGPADIIMSMT